MNYTRYRLYTKLLMLVVCGLIYTAGQSKAQLNISFFLNQGKKALIEEEPRRAIPYLNRIIGMNQEHYEAYFLRGIARYQLGDYFGAREDFDHVLQLNPYFTDAYHYRGIVKSRRHNYYGALKDFEEALSISPFRPLIMINKGIVQLSIGHHATAIATFNQALKLEPDNADAYLYRGRAMQQLGHADSALADYETAIRKNPFSYQAFLFRGGLYQKQESYIKALKDFRRAIQINENQPEAWFKRGRVKALLEDYQGAVADFTRVIERAPKSAVAYYNRALAYSEMEQYEKALSDYNQVLTFNSRHPVSYFNRGILYTKMEQYDQAIMDYTRAIDLMPDFEEAYINRSIVYSKTGQKALAMQDRQKARQINRYKNTTAYQNRDTTQLQNMIQLDANFDETLSGNEEAIVELLQNPSQLRLMPLLSLDLQSSAPSFFSPLISRYNARHPDSLYLVFRDSVKETSGKTAIKLQDTNSAINTALQERSKLNFNKALRILEQEKPEGHKEGIRLFARANTFVQMTDFIRNLETGAPDISYNNDREAGRQQQTTYDYSPALQALQKAMRMHPDFPAAHYNLGIIYARTGNFEKAKAQFDKAIALKNDFGRAYFNRAVVYFKTNQKAKGCADLSKAGTYSIPEAYKALNAVCGE